MIKSHASISSRKLPIKVPLGQVDEMKVAGGPKSLRAAWLG
jgi:hypothetical protein